MAHFAKMVQSGLSVVGSHLTGRTFPHAVVLSVTNRCNSHCRYCKIPSRNQLELSTPEIFRLIDEITALGTQRLGIWGGEPLMRDDIGAIIDHAKKRGLFTTLDSNGRLVRSRISELKNLDHLILSLDGRPSHHDAQRGAGSHQLVMEAIQEARRYMPVWTITVLTRANLEDVDYILDESRRLGFVPTFQVLHHNETMGTNDELMPDPDQYRKVLDHLLDARRRGVRMGTSTRALQHLRFWERYQENTTLQNSHAFRCWAGKFYCNVDTDGTVYPCSLLIGRVPARNFKEVGFKAAYESLGTGGCQACSATCYTEYNLIYSLDIATILEWAFARR